MSGPQSTKTTIREYRLSNSGNNSLSFENTTQTQNVITIANNSQDNSQQLPANIVVMWGQQAHPVTIPYSITPWQKTIEPNNSVITIQNVTPSNVTVTVTLSYVGEQGDPQKPIVLDWLYRQLLVYPNTTITAVKTTIHTGDKQWAGTDANVYFRVASNDWWLLDKPWYNDFERDDTDTYGPFQVSNLKATELSNVPIELKQDGTGIGPDWYVGWLRLEAEIPNHGWYVYKEWHPGWLESNDRYRKLQ
ncbi:MAG: PLAT/LH2 domain-containing protein [Calothrix sp. MO_167.B42]|nr:PLAT/LH2 domain-containing protein [Calothrix sp. MO_167.B42]